METSKSVAYQGVPGAFSEIAARSFFQGFEHRAFETFDAVVKAVQSDEVIAGMLPIENSSTGAIRAVYTLLLQAGLKIVGEEYVPVRHCLMVKPGSKLEVIEDVYSHPEALRQCQAFLGAHREWTQHAYLNTAKSAERVAEEEDETVAAIASKRAAEIYQLKILKAEIQDQRTNTTRFVVVAKSPIENTVLTKASMILRVSHQPGCLFEALGVFSKHHINMLKIESHPAKEVPWEYDFFIDLERTANEDDFQKMLAELSKRSLEYQLLGSYAANPLNENA
jgi:chorismate mutase/prephenate dehydratase